MLFTDFSFHPKLQDGLTAMGFESPTPIQEQAIPSILAHKDVIACAQTGTGKTAAYLLPVMHRIVGEGHSGINTLIIAPTRELALQIDQQVEGFAYFTGISSIAVYGGGDGNTFTQQLKAMREGADIIIATPGRLLALLTSSGSVDMSSIKHLILDEADRMLDMGFYEDIMRIISYLPTQRQTLLFSATMPPKIRSLAQHILHQPEQINIAISKPAEGIKQEAYTVYDTQKTTLLVHILQTQPHESIIIFAGTKEDVKQLHRTLKQQRIHAEAFHSDLEQAEREELMRLFKNRNLPILIGTDILSRGIDVDGIGMVINYNVPPDPEDYIHRIGRTARADKTGTAITFINPKDMRRFHEIELLMGLEVQKMDLPQGFEPGPKYEIKHRETPSRKPFKKKYKGKKKSG